MNPERVTLIRWIDTVLRLAGTMLVMHLVSMAASYYAFPMAGGEFHAIFAYSDGKPDVAAKAWSIQMAALMGTAALLVGAGVRLRWYVVALAATLLMGTFWWPICTWPGQNEAFLLARDDAAPPHRARGVCGLLAGAPSPRAAGRTKRPPSGRDRGRGSMSSLPGRIQLGPGFTAADVLAQLDDCARSYTFPMLDNGYIYPADVRLTAYRGATEWALAIEVVGATRRATHHDCIDNCIHLFGNGLLRPPGTANGDFLFPTSDGDIPTFDEEYGWTVRDEARTLRIRDTLVAIPRDPALFARKGIVVEEPPAIGAHELLRALVPEFRELFLATEAELRERIPGDLPVILRLNEWHHPDMAGDVLPSESYTFRMVADVLASGDASRYQPVEPANTHWSHWPEGGTLA